MKTRTKLIGIGAAVLAVAVGTHAYRAYSEEAGGFGPPFMHHRFGGMPNFGGGPGGENHRPGMMGMMGMMRMGHDSATMAQLRVIHTLFVNHDRIKRSVTNLPNGIRTVTESDDPQIAALLKTHVGDMIKRVGDGDDPGLPIESKALHSIFRDKDKIKTSTVTTPNGVVVVQTSDDPKVVAELQKHAAQVTDFANEGMAAVRTAMMRNFGGRFPGGMMGAEMMHGMPAMTGATPPGVRAH
jgi:hypothetical protein